MTRSKYLQIFLLLALFTACSSLPETDYYESEGVLSIRTIRGDTPQGWKIEYLDLKRSLVYKGDGDQSSPNLQFRFYLQNPGIYHLSVLTAILYEEHTGSVTVTISNPEGYIVESLTIKPPVAQLPSWTGIDPDGAAATVFLDQPGMYTIRVNHSDGPGLVFDALQLSLNNGHPPQGLGYPETREPDSEPLFAKREQEVAIPPASAFGIIADPAVLNELTGTDPDIPLGEVLVQMKGADQDSVSRLEHLKRSFEARRDDDSDRGFVLHPAAGMERPEFKKYPALWFSQGQTGFEELQQQIRFLRDPSLPTYEIPFFAPMPEWLPRGDDAGGEAQVELLLRWVQLSMLSPVMVLPLTDINTVELTERDLADIEEAVRFRRDLFPFIYSYTLRARTSGIRTVTSAEYQPGGLHYGEELFAIPVSGEGVDRLPVRFPEGDWYSWWSGERYEGGKTWLIDAYPNQLPLFVKAGSIIPKRSGGLPVSTGTNDSLTVDIFTGGVSSFRLYEDDGKTLNYLEGDLSTTAFRWFEQEGRAKFNIGAMVWGTGEGYRTDTRYLLRFRYLAIPSTVTANGEPLREGRGVGEWYYDEELRSVIIRWDQPSSLRTEIEFEW